MNLNSSRALSSLSDQIVLRYCLGSGASKGKLSLEWISKTISSSGSDVNAEWRMISGDVAGVWTEFIETCRGSSWKTGRSYLAAPGVRPLRGVEEFGVWKRVLLLSLIYLIFGASLPGQNSATRLVDIFEKNFVDQGEQWQWKQWQHKRRPQKWQHKSRPRTHLGSMNFEIEIGNSKGRSDGQGYCWHWKALLGSKLLFRFFSAFVCSLKRAKAPARKMESKRGAKRPRHQ